MRRLRGAGAAAAHLREGDAAAARRALEQAPGGAGPAREALDRYAAGRGKKPWVGGVLGLVPGLGYVYSGEYANAARSLILNSLFIWGMVEAAEEDLWGVFAVVTFGELTRVHRQHLRGVDAAHRHNARRLDDAVSTSAARGDPRGPPRPCRGWRCGASFDGWWVVGGGWADHRPQTTDHRLRTTDLGLRTTDHGPRTSDLGLRAPRAEPAGR